jgi:hypothetical protein
VSTVDPFGLEVGRLIRVGVRDFMEVNLGFRLKVRASKISNFGRHAEQVWIWTDLLHWLRLRGNRELIRLVRRRLDALIRAGLEDFMGVVGFRLEKVVSKVPFGRHA